MSGTVIDVRGAGVPGAIVELFSKGRSRRAVADRMGRFAFPIPVPPGTWDVDVAVPLKMPAPSQLLLGESQAAAELLVRVAYPVQTIRGRIVDDAGTPLQGVDVHTSGLPSQGRSDADGRFAVLSDGEARPGASVELSVRPPSNDFRPLDAPVACSWGDEGVEIVLRRRRTGALDVLVVEADTGRPVEEYAIRLLRDPRRGGPANPWTARTREAGRHPDGRLRIDGVTEDRHLLFVIPDRDDLAPTTQIVVDFVPVVTGTVRVELQPFVEVPVEVVRDDGNPVAGSRVELVRAQDDAPDPVVTATTTAYSPDEMYVRGTGFAIAWRLGEAVTDAEGRAVVRCARSDKRCTVRAMGPGHVPVVGPEVGVLTDAPPVRVVVTRGCRLRISVTAMGALLGTERAPDVELPARSRPTIRLVEVADRPRGLPSPGTIWRLDEGGNLRLDDLPAGRWKMLCHFRHFDGTRFESVQSEVRLAVVDLRPDAPADVVVDGTRFRRGRVEGVVTRNGEPVALGTLRVEEGERGADGLVEVRRTRMSVRTDPLGRFQLEGVLPGWYRVSVYDAGAVLRASDWVQLESGGAASIVGACRSARVRLRVTEADGAPAAGRQVVLEATDGSRSRRVTTDDVGRATLATCPVGTLCAIVFPRRSEDPDTSVPTDRQAENAIRLDPIVVAPGTGEQRFELVLPGR